ncbi:hypothetical protein ABEB36_011908 [Hypothenemus hampei]|uniref:Uncharacterized protein n=1 Tax=Hypothenemus hampei TaxID=57062 RepID=A0ABD1EA52_HYPHA
MNKFLIFASLLAVVLARPEAVLPTQDGHVSVTQSTLGTYRYLVNLKDEQRVQERLADGSIVGEYTAPDANGVLHTIRYTSGVDGFKVLSGFYPVPVDYTPEVQAAREEHLSVHKATVDQIGQA